MKKIAFVIVIIVLLLIIKGLLSSIYDLWQKQDLLVDAQKELDAQQIKNAKLKKELSYVQSQQFIDEEARNKLFLVKPGENKVIFAKDVIIQNSNPQTPVVQIPNWQKWLKLFF